MQYTPCFVIPRGLSTLYRCSLTTAFFQVKVFSRFHYVLLCNLQLVYGSGNGYIHDYITRGNKTERKLLLETAHCGPSQTIPWETLNQGLLQPQGELYPIQTIFNHRSRDQLLEFRTSFYETISSEFLVQGNFKHTQFSRENWYWRDSNSQPLAPKASAVSIELTWLLLYQLAVKQFVRVLCLCNV